MRQKLLSIAISASLLISTTSVIAADADLAETIDRDYQSYLGPLFKHFHANPELSTVENRTAARMAKELNAAGFEVTTGVGGTGVVAMLKNGDGPLVSMPAEMDGLPGEEN